MAKHAIVRTDLLQGTDDRASLVSVRYMGAGTTETEIDNGNVVVVKELIKGEREIYKGVTPAKDSAIEELILVATPEVMTDERKKNLNEFYNEAGAACRGYRLRQGNIFSVTAEALSGTPAVGSLVELQAGTMLKVVRAATSGSTLIGKIIEEEIVGLDTYYAILVDAQAAA